MVPLPAAASDPFSGKITEIDSGEAPQTVDIVRPARRGLVQAVPGDAVFIGDTVKTGKNIKVTIELADKSLINIGPESTFRVKGAVLTAAETKRNYIFKSLKGTIRFILSKVFTDAGSGATRPWQDSNIAVETPNAVAGVRGTDFVAVVDTDKSTPVTDIAVLDGLVTVSNISISIPDVVLLSANEVTTVKRGLKPSKPVALSQARRDELVRSTTPNAAGGALAEPQQKQAEQYTADDMARDIAGGAPLADVFEQAAASGMTVSQMMAEAMDAGVEPNVAVYTAITEGYPTRAVVEGALDAGAPLYDVIAAATTAGAEKRDIIAGATQSGAPAPDVASAFALASSGGAPVYGTGLTVHPTVETIVPSAPILVSGGGGVTPSTQPASPYQP